MRLIGNGSIGPVQGAPPIATPCSAVRWRAPFFMGPAYRLRSPVSRVGHRTWSGEKVPAPRPRGRLGRGMDCLFVRAERLRVSVEPVTDLTGSKVVCARVHAFSFPLSRATDLRFLRSMADGARSAVGFSSWVEIQ